MYFIIIFLIYSNYHYINANYILSQEATALGPSHNIGYLCPDSSLEPYRAEYGCGYPVKRLFELLELQTGQFDLQLHPMALQPQAYSRCPCLPLTELPRCMMAVVLIEVVFLEFDLIVIFSGRVGGAPVWRKME